MEIYKDLSSPASQKFEELLNTQLSKNKIEEGKIIEGKVTKVAANTTETKDELYYPIIIEIDDSNIKNDSKIVLQSGLVSDVSIIGEERTVLSYLINPITKLSQTALRD